MGRSQTGPRLAIVLIGALFSAWAVAQDYTGTYSDGGALVVALDHGAGGQIIGHVVMMSGSYELIGDLQADGTVVGGFASGGNSFYRFAMRIAADGASLVIEAVAVDFTGRPIGTPSQTLQLAKVTPFGRAPLSPLPTAPGQVPGRPDRVELPPAQAFVPGVRIVYYLGAASIMENRTQAVEDPSCAQTRGPDCFFDPRDGKWYRQRDVVPLGIVGMLQLDLLYLDATHCVARLNHYGLDPITGFVTFLGSDGFVVQDGTCGEFWIPPGRLARAVQLNPRALDVFRGPYNLGGRDFDAVRLGATSVTGSHQTYQASSGILIIGSDRATGTALTIDPNNVLRPSTVSTHLAHVQFLSLRHLGGFNGEPLPQHVLAANRLTYACSSATSMPTVPDVHLPCQQEYFLRERGSHWALLTTVYNDLNSATGKTFPQEGTAVLASGSPGGIFATPSLLRGLQAGQAIDFDPHTGASTFVSHKDESVVTIVEQGQLHRRELTYDLDSGWLVTSLLERRLSPMTVTIRAQLVAVE